jgi:hypothetical protein
MNGNWNDPRYPVFVMQCKGVCLQPALTCDYVMIDKRHPVRYGDYAFLLLRPERCPKAQGNPFLKRVVLGLPPFVTLPYRSKSSDVRAVVVVEMSNPFGQFTIDCDDLLAMYWATPLPEGSIYDAERQGWHIPSLPELVAPGAPARGAVSAVNQH